MSDAPEDDLDRLIAELDAGRRDVALSSGGLDVLLQQLAEHHGSDLFLLAGEPPSMRVHGRVIRGDGPPLDSLDVE